MPTWPKAKPVKPKVRCGNPRASVIYIYTSIYEISYTISISISTSMSIYLSISISTSLSIYSITVSQYLSINQSIYPSIYFCISCYSISCPCNSKNVCVVSIFVPTSWKMISGDLSLSLSFSRRCCASSDDLSILGTRR